jgi:hypothetical protein
MRNGKFSAPDAAHFVDRDGERYRVVRQYRRVVPLRHDPEKWVRFGDHIYLRTDFAVPAGGSVPFGGERFVRLAPRAVRSALKSFAPLLHLDPKVLVKSVSVNSRTPFVLHLASREGTDASVWRDVLSVVRSAGYTVVLDAFGSDPVYGGREAFERAADDGAAFLMKRG